VTVTIAVSVPAVPRNLFFGDFAEIEAKIYKIVVTMAQRLSKLHGPSYLESLNFASCASGSFSIPLAA
jgi:hypothetical protein